MKKLKLGLALALILTALPAGLTGSAQSAPSSGAKCQNGKAGEFLCKNIDLVSHVPAEVMKGAGIADVMGWVDPETKKEYAVLGSTEGVQFLDVTKPEEPVYIGYLAGKADGAFLWQELEILNDHVYVVCDLSPCNLQIFDLTRLREPVAGVFNPDAVFPIPVAHSIDSNPDTNRLFINGTGPIVAGQPIILDVSQPLAPVPVGATYDDGYTHDSLCRTYLGPDKKHSENEVCFNFNEDTVTIYDVTANPTMPEQLARVTYENASYAHSGALTKDHKTLISTDEGDETDLGINSTLYIWDVRKLAKPKLIGTFVADSKSIDHNIYSEEDALFHANYVNGFRILDLKNAHKGKLKEVAYFDTMPLVDTPDFDGAWAAYPYLPSGNVLVGNMNGGLFIVRPEDKIYKSLGVERK